MQLSAPYITFCDFLPIFGRYRYSGLVDIPLADTITYMTHTDIHFTDTDILESAKYIRLPIYQSIPTIFDRLIKGEPKTTWEPYH